MNNKIFIEVKYILCFQILIVLSPMFLGKQNILQALVLANYPFLILTNTYLMLAFYRIHLLNDIGKLIIPRIGYSKFYFMQIKYAIISLVAFITLYTIIIFIFYPLPPSAYLMTTLMLSCLNIAMWILEEGVLSLQIGKSTNIVYVIISILINMTYHYGYILQCFNN